jgi:phosphatidylglycerophosphatase A
MSAGRTTVKLVASALGLGHLPAAPGTWASGGAALVYLVLRGLPEPEWRVALGAAFCIALAAGLVVCRRAERAYGVRDPRQFVLDEVAGVWLVCLAFWWRDPISTAVLAFLAFRVFDVAKPFPVGWLERLDSPWGVMVDDLAAAAWSVAVLWPLSRLVLEPVLGV